MVKLGYKQTEIGVIPEDWDIRKIGDFTNAIAGGTPSTAHPEYWDGEILWMSSGELNKRRIYNVVGRITELGYSNSSTHLIPQNCVLIGLAGQGKTRGTVAINYVELCTNQSIAAIFPSTEYNSEYLYQYLWSRYEELRELSSGDGGRGGLNIKIIKDFPCAFPPLAEQERIAEALSDVDELISSLEKLIKKYKSIKATCLQQMFPQKGETTPKMRLPGFTGAWEQCKLGDVCQVTMGQSPDGSTYSDTPSDYILVQGNADLKDGWVSPRIWTTQKTKTAEAGDLIMSVRAPAGSMGKTSYNVVLGRGVAGIKGNEFIYQSLVKMDSDGYWKKLAAGSTFESINSDVVNGAELIVPQDIDEQNKIGDYFASIDNLITLHQRKLDKAKKIKQGMMQQLLTGKIRLM